MARFPSTNCPSSDNRLATGAPRLALLINPHMGFAYALLTVNRNLPLPNDPMERVAPDTTLYIVSAATGEITATIDPTGGEFATHRYGFAWSEEFDQIAYIETLITLADESQASSLWVYDLETSATRQITPLDLYEAATVVGGGLPLASGLHPSLRSVTAIFAGGLPNTGAPNVAGQRSVSAGTCLSALPPNGISDYRKRAATIPCGEYSTYSNLCAVSRYARISAHMLPASRSSGRKKT
jgi:hypothetical protein